jgi:hypothetical protein
VLKTNPETWAWTGAIITTDVKQTNITHETCFGYLVSFIVQRNIAVQTIKNGMDDQHQLIDKRWSANGWRAVAS